MLTIPDLQSNPTFDAQSVSDATDLAALVAGQDGTGVVSGCAVSPHTGTDMEVSVAAGTVMVGSTSYTVSATNLTIGAASSGDRRDIVVYTVGTRLQVVAGTPCGVAGWSRTSIPASLGPVKPVIPANSVLLAEVYVAATTTAIASGNIVDKTVQTGTYVPIGTIGVPTSDTLAETISRIIAGTNSESFPVAGGPLGGAVYLYEGQVVGHLAWCNGATAAVTPTDQWLGLCDASGNLLAVTADQTTTPINSYTPYSWPVAEVESGAASSFTVPTTGWYYIVLSVTASTEPTPLGVSPLIALMGFGTPYPCVYTGSALNAPPSLPDSLPLYAVNRSIWLAALTLRP